MRRIRRLHNAHKRRSFGKWHTATARSAYRAIRSGKRKLYRRLMAR